MLYYADRRGWMVSGLYSPEMADRLARLGARYYANAFGMVPEGQAFFRRMEQLSERLTSDDSPWTLYDLQPAARFSETEVQTSPPVNFADRIDFHGLTLRRLLHKPSVFEVIFRWQGLTTAKQDVNGFIHVVDSTGRTVYQQGHWPPGRRLSIEGKPGETFRDDTCWPYLSRWQQANISSGLGGMILRDKHASRSLPPAPLMAKIGQQWPKSKPTVRAYFTGLTCDDSLSPVRADSQEMH